MLKKLLTSQGSEAARLRLQHELSEYAAVTQVSITVVFDSSRKSRTKQAESIAPNVNVLFGDVRESADHVIERLVADLKRENYDGEIIVATSDNLQRDLVSAMGVGVMHASVLVDEITAIATERATAGEKMNQTASFQHRIEHHLDPETRAHLERLRRGEDDEA